MVHSRVGSSVLKMLLRPNVHTEVNKDIVKVQRLALNAMVTLKTWQPYPRKDCTMSVCCFEGAMTLSITTFSIMALSIMGLFAILSRTDIQHSNSPY
jgi:hypothetical protein